MESKAKNYSLFGVLFLVAFSAISEANIDCHGKAFHCMNSTHFMICVDLGGGISSTIDSFIIPCPLGTECHGYNNFECEFMPSTTQVSVASEVTNEKNNSTTVSWEKISVAAISPFQNVTKAPAEKYFNTVSITTEEEVVTVTTEGTQILLASKSKAEIGTLLSPVTNPEPPIYQETTTSIPNYNISVNDLSNTVKNNETDTNAANYNITKHIQNVLSPSYFNISEQIKNKLSSLRPDSTTEEIIAFTDPNNNQTVLILETQLDIIKKLAEEMEPLNQTINEGEKSNQQTKQSTNINETHSNNSDQFQIIETEIPEITNVENNYVNFSTTAQAKIESMPSSVAVSRKNKFPRKDTVFHSTTEQAKNDQKNFNSESQSDVNKNVVEGMKSLNQTTNEGDKLNQQIEQTTNTNQTHFYNRDQFQILETEVPKTMNVKNNSAYFSTTEQVKIELPNLAEVSTKNELSSMDTDFHNTTKQVIINLTDVNNSQINLISKFHTDTNKNLAGEMKLSNETKKEDEKSNQQTPKSTIINQTHSNNSNQFQIIETESPKIANVENNSSHSSTTEQLKIELPSLVEVSTNKDFLSMDPVSQSTTEEVIFNFTDVNNDQTNFNSESQSDENKNLVGGMKSLNQTTNEGGKSNEQIGQSTNINKTHLNTRDQFQIIETESPVTTKVEINSSYSSKTEKFKIELPTLVEVSTNNEFLSKDTVFQSTTEQVILNFTDINNDQTNFNSESQTDKNKNFVGGIKLPKETKNGIGMKSLYQTTNEGGKSNQQIEQSMNINQTHLNNRDQFQIIETESPITTKVEINSSYSSTTEQVKIELPSLVEVSNMDTVFQSTAEQIHLTDTINNQTNLSLEFQSDANKNLAGGIKLPKETKKGHEKSNQQKPKSININQTHSNNSDQFQIIETESPKTTNVDNLFSHSSTTEQVKIKLPSLVEVSTKIEFSSLLDTVFHSPTEQINLNDGINNRTSLNSEFQSDANKNLAGGIKLSNETKKEDEKSNQQIERSTNINQTHSNNSDQFQIIESESYKTTNVENNSSHSSTTEQVTIKLPSLVEVSTNKEFLSMDRVSQSTTEQVIFNFTDVNNNQTNFNSESQSDENKKLVREMKSVNQTTNEGGKSNQQIEKSTNINQTHLNKRDQFQIIETESPVTTKVEINSSYSSTTEQVKIELPSLVEVSNMDTVFHSTTEQINLTDQTNSNSDFQSTANKNLAGGIKLPNETKKGDEKSIQQTPKSTNINQTHSNNSDQLQIIETESPKTTNVENLFSDSSTTAHVIIELPSLVEVSTNMEFLSMDPVSQSTTELVIFNFTNVINDQTNFNSESQSDENKNLVGGMKSLNQTTNEGGKSNEQIGQSTNINKTHLNTRDQFQIIETESPVTTKVEINSSYSSKTEKFKIELPTLVEVSKNNEFLNKDTIFQSTTEQVILNFTAINIDQTNFNSESQSHENKNLDGGMKSLYQTTNEGGKSNQQIEQSTNINQTHLNNNSDQFQIIKTESPITINVENNSSYSSTTEQVKIELSSLVEVSNMDTVFHSTTEQINLTDGINNQTNLNSEFQPDTNKNYIEEITLSNETKKEGGKSNQQTAKSTNMNQTYGSNGDQFQIIETENPKITNKDIVETNSTSDDVIITFTEVNDDKILNSESELDINKNSPGQMKPFNPSTNQAQLNSSKITNVENVSFYLSTTEQVKNVLPIVVEGSTTKEYLGIDAVTYSTTVQDMITFTGDDNDQKILNSDSQFEKNAGGMTLLNKTRKEGEKLNQQTEPSKNIYETLIYSGQFQNIENESPKITNIDDSLFFNKAKQVKNELLSSIKGLTTKEFLGIDTVTHNTTEQDMMTFTDINNDQRILNSDYHLGINKNLAGGMILLDQTIKEGEKINPEIKNMENSSSYSTTEQMKNIFPSSIEGSKNQELSSIDTVAYGTTEQVINKFTDVNNGQQILFSESQLDIRKSVAGDMKSFNPTTKEGVISNQQLEKSKNISAIDSTTEQSPTTNQINNTSGDYFDKTTHLIPTDNITDNLTVTEAKYVTNNKKQTRYNSLTATDDSTIISIDSNIYYNRNEVGEGKILQDSTKNTSLTSQITLHAEGKNSRSTIFMIGNKTITNKSLSNNNVSNFRQYTPKNKQNSHVNFQDVFTRKAYNEMNQTNATLTKPTIASVSEISRELDVTTKSNTGLGEYETHVTTPIEKSTIKTQQSDLLITQSNTTKSSNKDSNTTMNNSIRNKITNNVPDILQETKIPLQTSDTKNIALKVANNYNTELHKANLTRLEKNDLVTIQNSKIEHNVLFVPGSNNLVHDKLTINNHANHKIATQTINNDVTKTVSSDITKSNNIELQEVLLSASSNKNNITHNINKEESIKKPKSLHQFECRSRPRGRYADKSDCRKFYICIGNREPIVGACPQNTVFSETRKQCTKNLSHCIINKQFRCTAEGRFSDLIYANVYYICVKNNLDSFVRFQFKCQNGYILNKVLVKCEYAKPAKLSDSKSININSENNSESLSAGKSTGKRRSNDNESVTSKKHKFECEKAGKFADSHDSRKYYICIKVKDNVYRRKKKRCDSDEVFDKDKKRCVDSESYERE